MNVVPINAKLGGNSSPAIPSPAPAAAPCDLIRNRDASLAEIAARLGIANESWRTIIGKVRILNAHYSFPDPRTPRIVKRAGQAVWLRGPQAIVRRSLFPRAQVELWFDNHQSATARAVEDRGEAQATATRLAANTRSLVASLADRRRA